MDAESSSGTRTPASFLTRTLAIACDHAGYGLKESLLLFLERHVQEVEVVDLGTHSRQSVDYPDSAKMLAEFLKEHPEAMGIGICGSGNGICMALNRFPHIRAAYGWNPEIVRLARAHNNANVLCLSGWWIPPQEAFHFVQIFLTTPFEGGRHIRRVEKLHQLPKTR